MAADLSQRRDSTAETAPALSSSPHPASSLRHSGSHSNAPAHSTPSSYSRAHSSSSPASSSSLADALGPIPSGSSQTLLSAAATSKAAVSSHPTQNTQSQEVTSPPSKRPRADLPTDQPLTTHGKPRERVYLACLQCRNRKVRCDGNKPECFNCAKRADPSLGQCSYDAAPRRRGKDRTPGSRKLAPFESKKTRTTRSRLEEEAKRKKAEAATAAQPARVIQGWSSGSSVPIAPALAASGSQSDAGPSSAPSTYSSAPPTYSSAPPTYSSAPTRMTIIDTGGPHGWQSLEDEFHTYLPDLLYTSVDALMLARRIEEEEEYPDSSRSSIPTPPSVQFTRQTWWDALLSFYASYPAQSWSSDALPYYGAPLTMRMREEATAHIAADLRFLFHVSLHWFSFIHVPRFFGTLFDPYRRQALQPSLVLALLALGTFFQSSELELGAKGRERALHLLDQAHATFQASLNSGWIDIGLVQTAWLLAIFEMQAHPKCATSRTRSAFRTLDSLIRSLQLTTLDITDSRTVTFAPGVVPIVPPAASNPFASFDLFPDTTMMPMPEGTCSLSIPQPDPVLPRPEGTCRLNIPQPDPVLPAPEGNCLLNIPQPDPMLPVPEGNCRLQIPQPDPILPIPEGNCRLSIPQPDPVLPRPEGTCRLNIPQPDPILPVPEGNCRLNIPQPESVLLPLPEGNCHLRIPQPDPTLPVPEGTCRLSIPQPDPILPRPEGNCSLNIPQPDSTPACDPQGRHNPYTYSNAPLPDQQPWQTESYAAPAQWDCGCSAYSLVADWPLAGELTPAWRNMPMWPHDVSEGEQQKEECRRLVWCTVILTVAHNTKTAAGTDREQQHLWIKDPANYALLFPGETFATAIPGMPHIPASKDSVWALYMRTLFLWNACLRARGNNDLSNADRAQFAMTAWLELDNVEAAMDRHTCDIQSGFMLQMREVLFNTRMVISNEFRRYIPEALTENGQALYRRKAKRWMTHMLNLAKAFRECQVISAKGEPTENSRRCMLSYWFMSQIMRALGLWHADRTLTIALEVAKAFAPCVEFMMMIWPSPGQRKEYEGLRNWLVRSCQLAGISPPERAIPPLKTGLAPPPAPSAASVMPPPPIAQPGPAGWAPSHPGQQFEPISTLHPNPNPQLDAADLHVGPDPFSFAAEQVTGAYHPAPAPAPAQSQAQAQAFHPQPHVQADFMPPFW